MKETLLITEMKQVSAIKAVALRDIKATGVTLITRTGYVVRITYDKGLKRKISCRFLDKYIIRYETMAELRLFITSDLDDCDAMRVNIFTPTNVRIEEMKWKGSSAPFPPLTEVIKEIRPIEKPEPAKPMNRFKKAMDAVYPMIDKWDVVEGVHPGPPVDDPSRRRDIDGRRRRRKTRIKKKRIYRSKNPFYKG